MTDLFDTMLRRSEDHDAFDGQPVHGTGETEAPAPVRPVEQRVIVRGKFLYAGDEKFWIKGVTYGTFGETEDGANVPERSVVEADFRHGAKIQPH